MTMSITMKYLHSTPLRRIVACLSIFAPAIAVAMTQPDMEIEVAWCRPTHKSVAVGACYLAIHNRGAEADRLVAVDASVAGRVELHMSSLVDGVMQMRPLAQGVEIPADSTVDFRERGYHLMLADLKAPLEAGATITGSLVFARAGAVPVTFHIEMRR